MSRNRGRTGSIFEPQESVTLNEADSAIFGEITKVDAGKQVAKPIDIMSIYPDPMQPRRVVPSQARVIWNGQPDTVAEMLKVWMGLVDEERGSAFPLEKYLNVGEDIEFPEEAGPLEESFISLVSLASDIKRNGLTYPVTLARKNQTYQLETGERRWLTFHLLYAFYQDEQWRKIPAREVDHVNVWRQASENSARTNLNAISRARQLALLLMDLYTQQGAHFHSPDEMVQSNQCDRPFYAQVADGDEFRIPRGKGTDLLATMGLKNEGQLRHYRALLRLPDEIWVKADDENWEEGKIRNYTVTTVTVSPRQPKVGPDHAPLFKRVQHIIARPPRRQAEQEKALVDIAALKQLLDQIEANIRGSKGHSHK